MRTIGSWELRRISGARKWIALVLVIVGLSVTGAHATLVTPSDRVVHYVTVRAAPTSQSTAVDKLVPGAQAEELAALSHWLQIKLDDGTVGYVSSTWVVEITTTPTPAANESATPTAISQAAPTNTAASTGAAAPVPLLAAGHPLSWWFVFKFNAALFPNCGGPNRQCPFGGSVQSYTSPYSQQFVYASSDTPTLQQGSGCVGDTDTDPVGATFGEVYNGAFHYVVWNDQFYNHPPMSGPGCHPTYCDAPWGHSKGMVAWNDAGDGLVMQVTTPSWPAAASKDNPRQGDGNTLGCIASDNDVKVSQHFFALQLTHSDLVAVLTALQNASVLTDPNNAQLVNNGGPADVQALVSSLGTPSNSQTYTTAPLSSGVELISKPSDLNVPPWQMVSALLGGVSLRVASWWSTSKIPTTTASTTVSCWNSTLVSPGAVAIATSGQWQGTTFGLKGGSGTGADFNHAKIGVSTSGTHHYVVFGDMNQEGTLSGSNGDCSVHQNGRGGLFFVMDNADLAGSVTGLLQGGTAPTS